MKQTKRLFLSFLSLLLCTIMCAQTEVTGTVVDDFGEVVIGATVKEKGTSNGTVTDFDGNFKIIVNKDHLVRWLPNSRSACTTRYEGNDER